MWLPVLEAAHYAGNGLILAEGSHRWVVVPPKYWDSLILQSRWRRRWWSYIKLRLHKELVENGTWNSYTSSVSGQLQVQWWLVTDEKKRWDQTFFMADQCWYRLDRCWTFTRGWVEWVEQSNPPSTLAMSSSSTNVWSTGSNWWTWTWKYHQLINVVKNTTGCILQPSPQTPKVILIQFKFSYFQLQLLWREYFGEEEVGLAGLTIIHHLHSWFMLNQLGFGLV